MSFKKNILLCIGLCLHAVFICSSTREAKTAASLVLATAHSQNEKNLSAAQIRQNLLRFTAAKEVPEQEEDCCCVVASMQGVKHPLLREFPPHVVGQPIR